MFLNERINPVYCWVSQVGGKASRVPHKHAKLGSIPRPATRLFFTNGIDMGENSQVKVKV